MTQVKRQIVIAVHDPHRAIRRGVESVLADSESGAIVVAHCIEPNSLDLPDSDRCEVIQVTHGFGYPGVAFNAGIAHTTAQHIGVMGSDDFFEKDALATMGERLDVDDADAVLAPLRHQGSSYSLLPPTLRRCNLQVGRDRLLYRTAPLGLFPGDLMRNRRFAFHEAVATGEDLATSLRLYTSGLKISLHWNDPAYVIGHDAPSRITLIPRPLRERLHAISDLLLDDEVFTLPSPTRRSLAVKLARVHIIPAVRSSLAEERGLTNNVDWNSARHCIHLCEKLSPGFARALSLDDREVLLELFGRARTSSFTIPQLSNVSTGNMWRDVCDHDSPLRRIVTGRLAQVLGWQG